jgi:ribosomal protein L37AE/L43A
MYRILVVYEDFQDNHVEYDAGNEDQPPACPACKTRNCEPGGGNWWCNDCGMEF